MTLVDEHAAAEQRYHACHRAWRESVDRNDPPLIIALRFHARREARRTVREAWDRLGCHNVRTRPCPSLDFAEGCIRRR